MKEFFKMFFASLLAMVIAGFVIVGLTVGLVVGLAKSLTEKDNEIVSGDVLVLDIGKHIHEGGQTNSFAMLSKGSAYEAGLYDVTKALSLAKNDSHIKGILIKLSPAPDGWATLQQLRISLADFKTSGKFIYAYGEDINQGAYFVATAADSIYLKGKFGFQFAIAQYFHLVCTAY